MHIKVFEFNSLNYYKKNCEPFKTDVNLDGFITSYEKDIKFDGVSPHKKFKHVFEFPELDEQFGLFVIEFISNGYSSRAILKKGTLSVIYKQSIAGQIAYIIDEDRKILTGENTGLHFKNQFFKADPDKGGKIIIPYEKQMTTGNAILVHNDFAQLVEFTRFPEKYTLDVAYIVSPESLIMGNQATVILKPCLKVNNRKCKLEVLSKTKATITTTSYVDHVPVSKVFEDITIRSDKDLELTFTVPANLESVKIDFETSIYNVSHQKTERLTSSHKIQLKTNNYQLTFYESHLRKVDNKYLFLVLGKNGEPVSNVDVIFNLIHCIYSMPNKQIQLTTDDEGIIDLGHLNGIKEVRSQIYLTTSPIYGNWQLTSSPQMNTFPEKIEILEDEEIELPFVTAMEGSKFSEDTFSFIRVTFNNKHIENCFDKAKFNPEKNSILGIVKISNLEQGYYIISFKQSNISIHLTVHAGTYWKDESFILKKNFLLEFKANKKIAYLKVRKAKHNVKEKKDEITIKVCNFNGNTRAHIMTSNFIAANTLLSFQSIKNTLQNSITSEKFALSKWRNAYLSNRKLGDEFRYVFDRKYLKRFTGNSLERPQILLKRMRIRETTFEEEVVNLGENYANVDMDQQYNTYQQELVEHSAAGDSPRGPIGSALLNGSGIPQPYRFRQTRQLNRHQYVSKATAEHTQGPATTVSEQYKHYVNFLKHSAIVKGNLKPDKNGNISFTVPSGKYNNLFVLVSDEENIVQSYINLPSQKKELNKRNLTLKKALDPKKYYNEVRNAVNLLEGDKHKIKDITSTDYTVIDSLEKAKNIQLEIAKMDGCNICPDLLFLTAWDKLSFEDQLKKYTTYSCHETNLFLYFKDREFFNKVVKPFLMNKLEKSFIDLWLLGEYDQIRRYNSVEFYDNLNSVEKVLLIYIIVQEDPGKPLY